MSSSGWPRSSSPSFSSCQSFDFQAPCASDHFYWSDSCFWDFLAVSDFEWASGTSLACEFGSLCHLSSFTLQDLRLRYFNHLINHFQMLVFETDLWSKPHSGTILAYLEPIPAHSATPPSPFESDLDRWWGIWSDSYGMIHSVNIKNYFNFLHMSWF